MIVAVLDLLNNATYTEYETFNEVDKTPYKLFSTPIKKNLLYLNSNGLNTNKGSYLVSKDNIVFKDIPNIRNHMIFSITKIILGLHFEICDSVDRKSFSIHDSSSTKKTNRKL